MLTSSLLQVDKVSASYSEKEIVVDNVSFTLEHGELGCLLGPSGCGKTTILRAISGFQELRCGSISLAGKLISTPRKITSPELDCGNHLDQSVKKRLEACSNWLECKTITTNIRTNFRVAKANESRLREPLHLNQNCF